MRFNKVLLIYPDFKAGSYGAIRPPAGLGYISQIIENGGIEYDVIDMAAGSSFRALKNKLKIFKPDLVGISMMSIMYKQSYNLVNFIKNVDHRISVAAGGAHLSTFRNKVLEDSRGIDFGIELEGEKTILELCSGKDLKEIKGLYFRENGGVAYNGRREFETNLDLFPYPLYSKFPLKNYISKEIGILASRGCPNRCIFCGSRLAMGDRYRIRSIHNILEEIEYWYSKGYRQICMLDSNFALIKNRVMELCDTVAKMQFKGLELKCDGGLRADTTDRDVLRKMKEAGFRYVSFGIESANERILNNVKKGQSIRDLRRAIEDALALGLEVRLSFVIGSPEETLKEFNESLAFAKEYPVFDAKFYNLVPYPDTELFNFVNKNKYFIAPLGEYLNKPYLLNNMRPAFATPYFSQRERIMANRMAYSVRKHVRYTWMKKRLKSLGFFAGILAKIYVNDYIQKMLAYSKIRGNLKKIFNNLTKVYCA